MKEQQKPGTNGTATANAAEKPVLKLEVPTPEPAAKLEKENAELKKQLEALKKKFNSIPAGLEEKIRYFEQKQKNIKRLENLKASAMRLNDYLGEIAEVAAADAYINDTYFLTLQRKKGYSSTEDIFRFANPVIVGEVVEFTLKMIKNKEQELIKTIES